MRGWLVGLALVVAGCPDFGLEDREFLCSRDEDCGELRCVEGVCAAAPDAGGEVCDNGKDDDGDELVDCLDPDCGEASCDDDNPCTADTCPAAGGGACENAPRGNGTICGAGCLCESGLPSETACGDMQDNDGDGDTDCLDTDCPCQMGTCCPAGFCGMTCPM